jgi:hypothetical protein
MAPCNSFAAYVPLSRRDVAMSTHEHVRALADAVRHSELTPRQREHLAGHCCIGGSLRAAGWADASSLYPRVHTEVWIRRFPLPTGGDHLGGALVPPLRIDAPIDVKRLKAVAWA